MLGNGLTLDTLNCVILVTIVNAHSLQLLLFVSMIVNVVDLNQTWQRCTVLYLLYRGICNNMQIAVHCDMTRTIDNPELIQRPHADLSTLNPFVKNVISRCFCNHRKEF